MIKPKRVVEKRQKVRRITLVVVLLLGILLCLIIAIKRLNIVEQLLGHGVISPLPGLVVFGNPKDELKSNLQKAGIDYSDIYVSSQSAYIVKQKEGEEIYFTSSKDIKMQVATLQLILSRLTIEGKSFNRLDLRYDKPVITLK